MVPTTAESQAEWPSRAEIPEVQPITAKQNGDLESDNDGLLRIKNKVLIPDDAGELKRKMPIVAQAGQAIHRGSAATRAPLGEAFTWKGMAVDIKNVLANCLLGKLPRSRSKATTAIDHNTTRKKTKQSDPSQLADLWRRSR